MARSILFFLGFLFFLPVLGQVLVKDINAEKAGFARSGQYCFPCGSYAYFPVSDQKGTELWRTDGTISGTSRVMDINPGIASSLFQFKPRCKDDLLFFIANDGSGEMLWKSNGTLSGTVKISSQLVSSDILIIQDNIAFLSGEQLWLHNVAANQTSMIFEKQGIIRWKIFGGASYIYFSLPNSSNEEELWRTDGTLSGTIFLKEINTLGLNGFESGSKFLFVGSDAAHGAELWASDGTPEGTNLVKDINPGPLVTSPTLLGIFNGKVVMTTPYDTWISDGTTSGTKIVLAGVLSYMLRDFEGKLYCLGYDRYGSGKIALFSTDGSPANNLKIGDLGDYIEIDLSLYLNSSKELPVVDGKLLVPHYNPSIGSELAYSKGVANDITLLKDINSGAANSSSHSFAEFGNQLIFLADDGHHGIELWKTDGTGGGTSLLKDTRTGTASTAFVGLTTVNNKLFFSGREGFSDPRDIWVSDATETGTIKIKDFSIGSGFVLGKSGNFAIFGNLLNSSEVYKVNSATGHVIQLNNSVVLGGFLNIPTSVGQNCYNNIGSSSYGGEIWKMNAFENSFHILKDINPGSGTSTPTYNGIAPQVISDKLIFPADDGIHGAELWISNGTEAGTNLLRDIASGSSSPSFLTQVGSRIYFRADDGIHGAELWATDGSAEGTSMIKDIVDGTTGALASTTFNSIMAGIGNSIVFSADDGDGMEVWISDGTEGGTKLLKDINLSSGSNPSLFTAINNKVYFTADDGIHGTELWVTDGTTAGTIMIEIVEGSLGSAPNLFSQVGDWTYFTADFKIWRTQGTLSTTHLVADIQPNRKLNVIGDWILFTAHTPEYGEELYKLPTIKASQTIVFQPIPIKKIGDLPFNLVGTVSSGLGVEYSSPSDKVSIQGNSVTLIQPGKVTIDANQPGNSFFESASTVSQSFCINPLKPIISTNNSNPSQPVLTSNFALGNLWYKDDVLLNENNASISITESGSYKLRINVDECESDFSESESFIITGLGKEHPGLSIRPNPANQILNVFTPLSDGSIQIFTCTGAKIYEGKVIQSELNLDVSSYSPGVYLLKVVSHNEVLIQKWIKK